MLYPGQAASRRDVEYREEGTNDWQLWQDETTETEMQFTVIPGHSLYFRVSSKDRVDNVGQSPELGPYTVELETRKYYYFGGQRVVMRVVTASTNQVYYLHGDHLGSVSLTTNSSGGVVAQARYMPYGEVRWESSPSPTDYAFTGQRLEQGFGLLDFNARYFSPRLGRFISADTLIPNPGSAIDFDRYMYAAGNPLRYIDPTGHWTEDELEETLGKDWREKYFGEDGVFYGRDELLEFLLSDNTTDPITLEIIRAFFNISYDAYNAGLDFSSIDAMGARVTVVGGLGGFGGLSGDVVINLTSGEFSIFGGPEGGFAIGVSGVFVGGITLYKNLPSNDNLRGTSKAVGLTGGKIIGLNAEKFWGGVHKFQFPTEVPDGSFIGIGGAVPGIAVTGSLSFSYELLRVDESGYDWFPYVPGPLEVITDIGDVLSNDILKRP